MCHRSPSVASSATPSVQLAVSDVYRIPKGSLPPGRIPNPQHFAPCTAVAQIPLCLHMPCACPWPLGCLCCRWRNPNCHLHASHMPSQQICARCLKTAHQIARPKTVVMQYMVLFSQRTVRLPSVVLSHQHDAAVCNPAPACDDGAHVSARLCRALSCSVALVTVCCTCRTLCSQHWLLCQAACTHASVSQPSAV